MVRSAPDIIVEITESHVLSRGEPPQKIRTHARLIPIGAKLFVEIDVLITRVGATPQAAVDQRSHRESAKIDDETVPEQVLGRVVHLSTG